jgi:PAS domain S-box-containing protein
MGGQQFSFWKTILVRLRAIAGSLVRPPDTVSEPKAQQQSRLLMAILICSLLGNALLAALSVTNLPDESLLLVLILIPVILSLYGIAKRGHTAVAAAGLVTILFVVFSISPLALVQVQHTEFFIVLPMILTALFFSFQLTVLVTVLAVVVPGVLGLILIPYNSAAIAERILFILPTGIMILVYIRHQRTLYALQQSELQTAYDHLVVSEALLEQRVEARTRELQRSERSLQEAEIRFHSLFEQSNDAVGILDFEGHMVGANRRAAEMLGYTLEEMQRITVRETSVQSSDSLEAIQRLLAGEQVPPYERLFRHKDGHTFPVVVRLELVRDMNGNPLHVQSVAQDVSTQQELENQIRLQSTALATTANAVMITDRKGDILWINPAYTTLTGYTIEEARGKNPRALVKSGTHDKAFFQELWDTILAGQNWQGKLINKRKDGSLYTEEQNITPVRDKNGEISHFVAIKQDISEREQAAAALREAQRHYYSLFEQSHDAVFNLDLQGKHLRINQRAADMLGYTQEEMLTMGMADVSAQLPQTRDMHKRLLAGEHIPVFERTFRHKDGHTIPVEINLELVRDEHDQPMYIQSVVRDISDRKKVESQIRLQSAALSATSNAVLIIDRHGVIEWSNPAYTSLTGHAPDEVWGKNYLELLRASQVESRLVQQMWDTITGGQNWQGQFVNRRKQGSPYTEEQIITPVRDENGEISHFIAIKQDISERQQTESALRESETRYRLITENINDVITKFSPDGTRTFVSPSCFNLLGYRPEEFVARKVYEDVHEADAGHSMRQLIQAIETRTPYFSALHRLRHKDGHFVWCEVNCTIVRDPVSDDVVEVITILHDITERKHAEDALRESEARYQSVVQAQTELICRYTPDLTITFVNNAYCRYFDKTQEELLGHSFLELVPEGNRSSVKAFYEELVRTQGTSTYEHEVVQPDGSLRWQMWTDTVIIAADGSVSAVQAVGVDITARKLAELALRKSESRLNNILDSMQEAVWSVELPDFKPVYFNAAIERVLGRPRSLFYSSDGAWWRMVYQSDIHVLGEMLKEVQESGRSTNELRVVHPNGELRWVYLQMWPVRDLDGVVVGLEGMVSDITARKQMEIVQQSFLDDMRALQSIHLELSRIDRLDALYKQMVALPRERLGFERFALFVQSDDGEEIVGTYGIDKDGKLRDESAYKETITPTHWTRVVLNAPDHVRFSKEVPLYDNGLVVGKGWKADAALWNGQGAMGYLVTDNYISGRPARPYEAELISVLGSIFGHLIERKRAEESLQRNEARLNNILDSMQEAVWSVELPDFKPVYFNAAVERVFGRPRRLFYTTEGMWGRMVHPGDTALFQQMIHETRRTSRSARELRVLHPDGAVRWVDAQMWLVRNQEGQAIGLEGMAGDITIRKEVENVQQSFLEDMRALQRIHLELSRIDDLESLYKQMIVMTRVWLGLERGGVVRSERSRR